ncbi:SDR family NAD(P)-dependent oxidoreductase [Streptomyces sp. NPDC001388]|uniref:SDR family NAD(P)-dependent oxidoreductase n=1 Tax=Streptomyces sp. NPDC001388 TaxID=3364568 RepID=UPI0036B08D5B
MTGMNSTAPRTRRIVAVTGAGTGIGRATTRAFAAEDAHVVAIGRRAEPLLETAAENDRITALTADITAEGEPSRILQAVLERVVAVAPGAIDTPIGEHQGLTPERMAAVREWQLAHPGERGRAVNSRKPPAACRSVNMVYIRHTWMMQLRVPEI